MGYKEDKKKIHRHDDPGELQFERINVMRFGASGTIG